MSQKAKQFYAFGPFLLDATECLLTLDGKPVPLAPKAFEALLMLVENAGHLIDKDDLMKRLWPDSFVEEGNVAKHVSLLRKILSEATNGREYIETIPKRGYRFVVDVRVIADQSGDHTKDPRGTYLIGKKVSHYRVLEILGGGGMGLVYKAEDLKLGRRVALKFLPEELANDAVALERFEREARAASALNHPNICTIHETEEYAGQPFIVMELLEGQTVRELISAQASLRPEKYPLQLGRLLDIAIQITEGLDAAHRKGIIHRDIKPANIFLTTQGQAKILDFGLVKLQESEAQERQQRPVGEQQPAQEWNPNLTLTRAGVTIGTAGYMSPEQVRGENLDARTDLFSFGMVLYEMATGQQAFTGDTAPMLREAILNHTPVPARQLNPELPPKLGVIIHRAMEKDRESRYQTASEVRADLKGLKQDLESALISLSARPSPASASTQTSTTSTRRGIYAVGGALAMLCVVALAVFWYPRRSAGLPEIKLRQLTRNSSDNPVRSGSISPDGKYLAYADRQGIHIEVVATGDLQLVPQPRGLKVTGGEWNIADWFPDSTRFLINFSPPLELEAPNRQSSIWAVSVLGEAPRMLRNNADACSVSPDGRLINFNANYGRFGAREIGVMNSSGKEPRKLYETTDDNIDLVCGPWSPDGQHFLSVTDRGLGQGLPADIQVRDLKGGPPRTILSSKQDVSTFAWLRDGRLIYSLEEEDAPGSCNFWEMRLSPTGEPVTKARRLTGWAGFCMAASSPTADGKQLAIIEAKDRGTVFIAALEKTRIRLLPKQFTLSEGWDMPKAWTRDGLEVIFTSNRSGNFGIYRQALDSEIAEPLVVGPDNYFASCVSPDGRWLLYNVHAKHDNASTPDRIMRIPIAGGPVEPVLTGDVSGIWCARAPATLCAISERTPDRKQLVFTAFDPIKGRQRELARFETEPSAEYAEDLTSDGNGIAIVQRLGKGAITILSLADGTRREISVSGWTGLETVSWTADGKGLFATTHVQRSAIVLGLDLNGNSRPLWTEEGGTGLKVVPSPDGRHLALYGRAISENVWMMENF